MEAKNIILIGLMGSGKSTVGRLLAEKIGLNFVDTDQELEKWTGRIISEIFATDGEKEFRRLETQIVSQVVNKTGQIIATGGGVILRSENIKALRKNGIIIFLNADVEVLYKRLKDDNSRPLLQTNDLKKKLKDIFESRLELYCKTADFEIDTSNLEPEEITQKIVQLV